MSSKTQYKEYTIRLSKEIRELKTKNTRLIRENIDLRKLNFILKNQLAEMPKHSGLKRWWQFWR